jgi:Transposase DDE domain
MFIRQYFKNENGQRTAYWALVESYRAANGPRQRVVAWLGKLDEAGRLGVLRAAEAAKQSAAEHEQHSCQQPLNHQLQFEFDDAPAPQPRWVEVNAAGVRVENLRQFGGSWMALQLIRALQLDTFLQNVMEDGRESVPWDITSLILIIARLLEPSSELYISEQWYPKTSLPDLLGVSEDHVDDNRLYRCLDKLLPHKEALEVHLKNRMGELFDLEYDLLMYDVTSTFFEGRADFPLAQRGYSRDQRSDCKQVCIALVVSKCGMPLGYEVFAGNTADVTTVEHIVEMMEKRYGRSDRIWVMDRGMVSEENIEFLRDRGRRYIIGTPKSMLKKFEQDILKDDWHSIRDGLEVKFVMMPASDSGESQGRATESSAESRERFILCRSRERSKKEEGMTQRFEKKIADGLWRMSCGNLWGNFASGRAWATNPAGCLRNCPTSAPWTWCCQPALAPKSGPAAFQSPRSISKSSSKNSDSDCPPK